MNKKYCLMLIVIALSLSMIACSTGRSQRYPQRYPNDPSYPGGGYPNYPGTNGFEQIRTLANDLKNATGDVKEEAEELQQQGSDFYQNIIAQLEELDQEAKDFDEEIDNGNDRYGEDRAGYPEPGYDPRQGDPRYSGYPGYQGPQHKTREQFVEVLQKYYSARNRLGELSQEDDVQKDFERVTGIMRNLTRLYGYRFEPDYEYLEPTIR